MSNVFSNVGKAVDWPRKKAAGFEILATLGSIGALNFALIILALAPFGVVPGVNWVLAAAFGAVAILEVPKLLAGLADIY